MTATNANTNVNTNTVEGALRLQQMSLEELHAEAKRLGVQLKTTDHAEIIDALIAASVEQPTTAEPGMLISLHSRDEKAKGIIMAARNIILQNEQAGRTFSLFLQNREGSFYTQRAPGCRVSAERLNDVLSIVAPLPDGSQNEVLESLKANPEKWEEPLLVRLRRRNSDGSYSTYVMLYVKKRQRLAEQTF